MLVAVEQQTPLGLLLVLHELARLGALLQVATIERQYARHVLHVREVAGDRAQHEHTILGLLALGARRRRRRTDAGGEALVGYEAELELVEIALEYEAVVIHFGLRLLGEQLHLGVGQAHAHRGGQCRVAGEHATLLDADVDHAEELHEVLGEVVVAALVGLRRR